jgi:DNA-directed RNA polymerase specialized sigma24 family protein
MPESEGATSFPLTQSHVLRAAAADQWEQFLAQYFRPCWREVQLACRKKGILLPDQEDIFQELLLRFVRPGQIKGAAIKKALKNVAPANLPGRYLQGQQRGLPQARFRTYLQNAIIHLVREHLRASARRGRGQLDELLPCIEQSVTRSLEKEGTARVLAAAAASLRAESQSATTKAHRRQYAVLHATIVCRESAHEIAARMQLARSTVAGILAAARTRWLAILAKQLGPAGLAELREVLKRDPTPLTSAFDRFPP